MDLRFNFDACLMHSPFGLVHLTHQNPSARALFFSKFTRKSKYAVINPSSPKGGLYQPPVTVFALVLKIAQPRGKIAPGTFKFILPLHFSEKNSEPTTYTGGSQSWGVRGVGAIPWFLNWLFWKKFEEICTHKFVCKLKWPFLNIFCKKSHENRMFLWFFT